MKKYYRAMIWVEHPQGTHYPMALAIEGPPIDYMMSIEFVKWQEGATIYNTVLASWQEITEEEYHKFRQLEGLEDKPEAHG